MTDTAMIVGFLAPAVISAINREAWASQTKAIAAFALCLIFAAFVAWYEKTLALTNVREALPYVFGTAIISYQTYWKPSGMADKISVKTG